MKHHKVESSNLYSLGFDAGKIEARFRCPRCKGSGVTKNEQDGVNTTCQGCNGIGHGDTWVYSAPQGKPDPTEETFRRVLAGEPVENSKPSIGVAFHLYVKSKLKGEKKK